MNTQFLQSQISSITSTRNKIDWLTLYLTQAEKVANFGCNIGIETLALMWLLQTTEATGLDIGADNIIQARGTLRNLREEVELVRRAIHSGLARFSEEDHDWWQKLPDFFTRRILENDFSLDYRVCDITKPTGLPDNHYDLAFCDFVLHHIWYDEAREYAEQDAQLSISEMARVIKPEGIVAARELIEFNDKPRLAFSHLFETAGLAQVYVQEDEVEGLSGKGWVGKYVYRKRA